MINSYFKFIRSGINTTYQDKGRENLYHIGIPYSGAMDNRNFLIANKLVNNNLNAPVLEFAYQGPHLKYQGDTIIIAITALCRLIVMQGKEMDALMLIGEASAVLILAAAAYIMSLKDKVSLEKKKEFAEDKSPEN